VSVDETPLPVDLERVQEAVGRKCLMSFRYNGTRRRVDPYSYRWFRRDVLLLGRDRGDGVVKSFAVRRMLDLTIAEPDSAEVPHDSPAPSLDPITWLVDPPVEAVLASPGYTEEVIDLLGGTVEGDFVRVTVTNRLVFFARLFELGSRVRLDGPPELRAHLRDRLKAAM
jgi:predicted DNA-binding transcriptional regulator YafY